jgi:hypothetical protein
MSQHQNRTRYVSLNLPNLLQTKQLRSKSLSMLLISDKRNPLTDLYFQPHFSYTLSCKDYSRSLTFYLKGGGFGGGSLGSAQGAKQDWRTDEHTLVELGGNITFGGG